MQSVYVYSQASETGKEVGILACDVRTGSLATQDVLPSSRRPLAGSEGVPTADEGPAILPEPSEGSASRETVESGDGKGNEWEISKKSVEEAARNGGENNGSLKAINVEINYKQAVEIGLDDEPDENELKGQRELIPVDEDGKVVRVKDNREWSVSQIWSGTDGIEDEPTPNSSVKLSSPINGSLGFEEHGGIVEFLSNTSDRLNDDMASDPTVKLALNVSSTYDDIVKKHEISNKGTIEKFTDNISESANNEYRGTKFDVTPPVASIIKNESLSYQKDHSNESGVRLDQISRWIELVENNEKTAHNNSGILFNSNGEIPSSSDFEEEDNTRVVSSKTADRVRQPDDFIKSKDMFPAGIPGRWLTSRAISSTLGKGRSQGNPLVTPAGIPGRWSTSRSISSAQGKEGSQGNPLVTPGGIPGRWSTSRATSSAQGKEGSQGNPLVVKGTSKKHEDYMRPSGVHSEGFTRAPRVEKDSDDGMMSSEVLRKGGIFLVGNFSETNTVLEPLEGLNGSSYDLENKSSGVESDSEGMETSESKVHVYVSSQLFRDPFIHEGAADELEIKEKVTSTEEATKKFNALNAIEHVVNDTVNRFAQNGITAGAKSFSSEQTVSGNSPNAYSSFVQKTRTHFGTVGGARGPSAQFLERLKNLQPLYTTTNSRTAQQTVPSDTSEITHMKTPVLGNPHTNNNFRSQFTELHRRHNLVKSIENTGYASPRAGHRNSPSGLSPTQTNRNALRITPFTLLAPLKTQSSHFLNSTAGNLQPLRIQFPRVLFSDYPNISKFHNNNPAPTEQLHSKAEKSNTINTEQKINNGAFPSIPVPYDGGGNSQSFHVSRRTPDVASNSSDSKQNIGHPDRVHTFHFNSLSSEIFKSPLGFHRSASVETRNAHSQGTIHEVNRGNRLSTNNEETRNKMKENETWPSRLRLSDRPQYAFSSVSVRGTEGGRPHIKNTRILTPGTQFQRQKDFSPSFDVTGNSLKPISMHIREFMNSPDANQSTRKILDFSSNDQIKIDSRVNNTSPLQQQGISSHLDAGSSLHSFRQDTHVKSPFFHSTLRPFTITPVSSFLIPLPLEPHSTTRITSYPPLVHHFNSAGNRNNFENRSTTFDRTQSSSLRPFSPGNSNNNHQQQGSQSDVNSAFFSTPSAQHNNLGFLSDKNVEVTTQTSSGSTVESRLSPEWPTIHPTHFSVQNQGTTTQPPFSSFLTTLSPPKLEIGNHILNQFSMNHVTNSQFFTDPSPFSLSITGTGIQQPAISDLESNNRGTKPNPNDAVSLVTRSPFFTNLAALNPPPTSEPNVAGNHNIQPVFPNNGGDFKPVVSNGQATISHLTDVSSQSGHQREFEIFKGYVPASLHYDNHSPAKPAQNSFIPFRNSLSHFNSATDLHQIKYSFGSYEQKPSDSNLNTSPKPNTTLYPLNIPSLSPFDKFLNDPLSYRPRNKNEAAKSDEPRFINSDVLEHKTEAQSQSSRFSHLINKHSITFQGESNASFDHIPALIPDKLNVVTKPPRPLHDDDALLDSRDIVVVSQRSGFPKPSFRQSLNQRPSVPIFHFTTQSTDSQSPHRIDTSFNNKYKHSTFSRTYRIISPKQYKLPLGMQYMNYNPLLNQPTRPNFVKRYNPKVIFHRLKPKSKDRLSGIPDLVEENLNKTQGMIIRLPRGKDGGVILEKKRVTPLNAEEGRSLRYENVHAIVNPETNVIISFKSDGQVLGIFDQLGQQVNDRGKSVANNTLISGGNIPGNSSEEDPGNLGSASSNKISILKNLALLLNRPTPRPVKYVFDPKTKEFIEEAMLDDNFISALMNSSSGNETASIQDLIDFFESYDDITDKLLPEFYDLLEDGSPDSSKFSGSNSSNNIVRNDKFSKKVYENYGHEAGSMTGNPGKELNDFHGKGNSLKAYRYSVASYNNPMLVQGKTSPSSYMKLHKGQSNYAGLYQSRALEAPAFEFNSDNQADNPKQIKGDIHYKNSESDLDSNQKQEFMKGYNSDYTHSGNFENITNEETFSEVSTSEQAEHDYQDFITRTGEGSEINNYSLNIESPGEDDNSPRDKNEHSDIVDRITEIEDHLAEISESRVSDNLDNNNYSSTEEYVHQGPRAEDDYPTSPEVVYEDYSPHDIYGKVHESSTYFPADEGSDNPDNHQAHDPALDAVKSVDEMPVDSLLANDPTTENEQFSETQSEAKNQKDFNFGEHEISRTTGNVITDFYSDYESLEQENGETIHNEDLYDNAPDDTLVDFIDSEIISAEEHILPTTYRPANRFKRVEQSDLNTQDPGSGDLQNDQISGIEIMIHTAEDSLESINKRNHKGFLHSKPFNAIGIYSEGNRNNDQTGRDNVQSDVPSLPYKNDLSSVKGNVVSKGTTGVYEAFSEPIISNTQMKHKSSYILGPDLPFRRTGLKQNHNTRNNFAVRDQFLHSIGGTTLFRDSFVNKDKQLSESPVNLSKQSSVSSPTQHPLYSQQSPYSSSYTPFSSYSPIYSSSPYNSGIQPFVNSKASLYFPSNTHNKPGTYGHRNFNFEPETIEHNSYIAQSSYGTPTVDLLYSTHTSKFISPYSNVFSDSLHQYPNMYGHSYPSEQKYLIRDYPVSNGEVSFRTAPHQDVGLGLPFDSGQRYAKMIEYASRPASAYSTRLNSPIYDANISGSQSKQFIQNHEFNQYNPSRGLTPKSINSLGYVKSSRHSGSIFNDELPYTGLNSGRITSYHSGNTAGPPIGREIDRGYTSVGVGPFLAGRHAKTLRNIPLESLNQYDTIFREKVEPKPLDAVEHKIFLPKISSEEVLQKSVETPVSNVRRVQFSNSHSRSFDESRNTLEMRIRREPTDLKYVPSELIRGNSTAGGEEREDDPRPESGEDVTEDNAEYDDYVEPFFHE